MFATGDVVNQPLIDVTTEIANLSRSGLAPVQILEKLQSDYARMGVPFPQDLGFATIERIAREVGGPLTIINPDLDLDAISTQANTITNIVPPVTGGFFTPDKTIPDLQIPDFTEDIQAIGSETLDDFGPTEQALQPNLVLPDLSEFDLEDLPQVVDRKIGPNEIRLSDGRIIDFTQGIKNIQDGSAVDTRLYRIFNSPDIERGANVEKALEEFIARDEPGLNRLFSGYPYEPSASERRGGFFAPEDIGSSFYQLVRKGRDALMEGGERLAGGLEFFLGKEQAGEIQDFFEGDRFSESPGYFERGGLTKEEIDRLVLITGGINPDQIASDLEEVEETSTKTDTEIIAEQQQDEEESLETPDSLADEAVLESEDQGVQDPPAGEGKLPDETLDETTDETTGETPLGEETPKIEKTKESRFAEFTRSPDFIRFVRNIGKGLAQTGEFAGGVTLGAAAAAEEKYQEQIAEAERNAEILKEMAKSDSEGALESADIERLNKRVDIMNTYIKEYEGGEASIDLMNELIGLFEQAGKDGIAVTGGPGLLARLGDSLDAFTGNYFTIGDGKTSISTQIQQAIEQVKQRTIRDILQESGRTISDLDREIVDKIFGSLDLYTPADQILKKLKNARERLIESNREKQRKISDAFNLVQDPVYKGVGTKTIMPYYSTIQNILKADATKAQVFEDIDLRSLDLLK
tara:strand:+ start:9499 stop:11577 length:2079 start_codon:yes stop_codon:yes gene_type:complete